MRDTRIQSEKIGYNILNVKIDDMSSDLCMKRYWMDLNCKDTELHLQNAYS